jgi:dipeptidase
MTTSGTAFAGTVLAAVLTAVPCPACTSLLVTRGASADGSVIITYTCDGVFHPRLEFTPAADHPEGDSIEITDWHGQSYGKIPQVPHTFAVVGMMNEHQLAIGETTFGGREDLVNPEGMLSYWDLIELALARARTAREAIMVMTDLVARYGYRSSGESFSIADTREAWIMEMIGPGEGGQGAHWVALRVPDGYISCHANKARIGEFPVDDPDHGLFSENVISFAVAKGYYDPDSGEPFRYADAYCPPTPENRRWADTRVWSIFRRAAPSKNLSPDYHRGVPNTEPYPLWIRADRKLTLADVFDLMRDHYEGTPFDMTVGVDAGPYGSPYRWRPLSWRPDSADTAGPEYAWERPVSTQQTGFSFVSQSRAWLPDKIGGVYWYGVDDTYMTCYVPLYCGIEALPESFTVGRLSAFSWESAWWVFNFVANYAQLKYSFMAPEIQAVQRDLESTFLALQPAVEQSARALAESDRELMVRYLTDYSVTRGELVVDRWRALGEHLLTKYNDGYVKDENGRSRERGYPEGWLSRVVQARPEQFRLPDADTTVAETKLED